VPALGAGTAESFDMSQTLPSDAVRGGSFAVASNGASLPTGMTLSSAGILAVGSASIGTVDGVIFTYEAP